MVKLKPEAELKAEPEVEPQAGQSKGPVEQLVEELEDVQPKPKLQEKAEPVAPKPAPPGPVQQEQLPVLTTQGLGAGIPMGGMDGELVTSSQDAVGELLESCWLGGAQEAVQSHLLRTISQGYPPYQQPACSTTRAQVPAPPNVMTWVAVCALKPRHCE